MITFIVASPAVMVIHCCILVGTKMSVMRDLWGIKSILQHLLYYLYINLNVYAEFDSKFSKIMFLHDYHLACEVSKDPSSSIYENVARSCMIRCMH